MITKREAFVGCSGQYRSVAVSLELGKRAAAKLVTTRKPGIATSGGDGDSRPRCESEKRAGELPRRSSLDGYKLPPPNQGANFTTRTRQGFYAFGTVAASVEKTPIFGLSETEQTTVCFVARPNQEILQHVLAGQSCSLGRCNGRLHSIYCGVSCYT